MNEYVFSGGTLDKAVPFCSIEPLHNTLRHVLSLNRNPDPHRAVAVSAIHASALETVRLVEPQE